MQIGVVCNHNIPSHFQCNAYDGDWTPPRICGGESHKETLRPLPTGIDRDHVWKCGNLKPCAIAPSVQDADTHAKRRNDCSIPRDSADRYFDIHGSDNLFVPHLHATTRAIDRVTIFEDQVEN